MKRKILLGLTGSVATILYQKLIEELQKIGDVRVILTEKAEHFVSNDFLKGVKVFREIDEWTWHKTNGERGGKSVSDKWERNDPVLHINLRDEHSALVIAPCSANTLGKIANGMCDNLLTSVARAWDANRPCIIAPAMNTHMWEHPVTEKNLRAFANFSVNNFIVPPQKKMLACNTYGMGALADIQLIVNEVRNSLRWKFPILDKYTMERSGIPIGTHPGAFNAKRKNSTHTGVDIYVNEGQSVTPVEDGKVVAVEPFTGPKDNSPWWLDTDCVLVEGASGVICYGEVKPSVVVGQRVFKGMTQIGTVLRVIPPERPQHPEIHGWRPSMLHMEVYPHGYYKPSDGYGNSFHYLQDPTQFLIEAEDAPTTHLVHPRPW